jgi:hypothetical protein
VGYVSWACGGGYGFYVGTYGFGVDQILGARDLSPCQNYPSPKDLVNPKAVGSNVEAISPTTSPGVEPGRASARVGGGVIAGTLQETLGSQGLFTPTGILIGVDNLSPCQNYPSPKDLVNPKAVGSNVEAISPTTSQDPELLWALRGAGAGTFGIVTELRVKVYPVPDLPLPELP